MKNKTFIYLDKKCSNYQPFYLSIIFDKENYQMLMDYFADYRKKHKSYGGVLNNVSFRYWNFHIKNYKTVWFKLLNYDNNIILEAGNEILWVKEMNIIQLMMLISIFRHPNYLTLLSNILLN